MEKITVDEQYQFGKGSFNTQNIKSRQQAFNEIPQSVKQGNNSNDIHIKYFRIVIKISENNKRVLYFETLPDLETWFNLLTEA